MTSSEQQGPWRNAKIERISQLTPRIKSFFLDVSELASRRAGQHISVRLTAPDGYVAQRSYSIASAPRADTVEIIIEARRWRGVAFSMTSRRWAKVSRCVGRSVGISFWGPPMAGPLLLIAGGSGIAPLMAMVARGPRIPAEEVAPTGPWLNRHRCLCPCCWSAPHAPGRSSFHAELLELEAARPDFTFIAVTTREPPPR